MTRCWYARLGPLPLAALVAVVLAVALLYAAPDPRVAQIEAVKSTLTGIRNSSPALAAGAITLIDHAIADLTAAQALIPDIVVPCTYTIAPASVTYDSATHGGSISVTTQVGCAWTSVSNAAFITITAGASGTGSGTSSYSITANTTTTARSGTITIAGKTFTIAQAGKTCTFSISPTSVSAVDTGQTGTVTVTATLGCGWTAVSNAGFITITAGASGTGNGTVSYSIAANTGAARTGTATIATRPFTVSQGATPAEPPAAGDSHAMGLWSPHPKFDTCTKAQHDAIFVIGPDGKKYPTWHAPLGPGGCKFGHDHGRNPQNSQLWADKQIQTYFYFDANKNGVMDPAEEAVTGLPFGYTNEQLDVWGAANNKPDLHRHEDHVGHKVEYANGEPDIATHKMSTNPTGGVWVGRNNDATGKVDPDTGVRCFYLSKVHQGVSTADAFTNNIHEVVYFSRCVAPNPAQNTQLSLAFIQAFNKPGGFTNFMPMCKIERRSNPLDFIFLGTNSLNSQYPTGPSGSDREIISRQCVEIGFLVPAGQFSGNFYEAWPVVANITDPLGKRLVWDLNLLFDVEDANRYYYPEATKQLRGYNNPEAGLNRGFSMDLCYDNSLNTAAGGFRKYRGGPCDIATQFGKITGITWDDPRSAFTGLHRGLYFIPGIFENGAGPEFWYTDPFGKNARTTAFVGAVRQQIAPKTVNYRSLIGGQPIDARVADRIHDDGGKTVHAPN